MKATQLSRLLPILALSLLLAGPGYPALAQIANSSPGKVKAANRKALREARKSDAPYKDTHLAVPKKRLKRGASEPEPVGADGKLEYKTVKTITGKESNGEARRRRRNPEKK